MRYLFTALVGLVLGAAAAGVVLYYNPLSGAGATAPGSADRVFRYSLPADVLDLALGGDAKWFGGDTKDEGLWEETVDRSAVVGLVLRDDSGQPAAIASRLMTTSAQTDLLLRGVVLNDQWLVTIPGSGTMFVRADSNAWPFLKEALLPVWYFERPWHGPAEYWPTVGPSPDNTGIVVGIAGAFGGSEGRVVERYELTELDPARRTAAATGELHLALSTPQAAQ